MNKIIKVIDKLKDLDKSKTTDKVKVKVKFNEIKEVDINLREVRLKGNVLDAGIENYGIIYNLFKENNEEVAVDYIEPDFDKKEVGTERYDTAALFFSLSKFMISRTKAELIKELCSYLKEDGEIMIWDIEKKIGTVVNLVVNVLLPEGKSKRINVRDMNVIKNATFTGTLELLKPYFDIVEMNAWNNIYYIKARKKGRCSNESSISGT